MNDTSAVCGAAFSFFLHVSTACGRPAGHDGVHHPVPFAIDMEDNQ